MRCPQGEAAAGRCQLSPAAQAGSIAKRIGSESGNERADRATAAGGRKLAQAAQLREHPEWVRQECAQSIQTTNRAIPDARHLPAA